MMYHLLEISEPAFFYTDFPVRKQVNIYHIPWLTGGCYQKKSKVNASVCAEQQQILFVMCKVGISSFGNLYSSEMNLNLYLRRAKSTVGGLDRIERVCYAHPIISYFECPT